MSDFSNILLDRPTSAQLTNNSALRLRCTGAEILLLNFLTLEVWRRRSTMRTTGVLMAAF